MDAGSNTGDARVSPKLRAAHEKIALLEGQIRARHLPSAYAPAWTWVFTGFVIMPCIAFVGAFAWAIIAAMAQTPPTFNDPPAEPASTKPPPDSTWYPQNSASPIAVDVNGDGRSEILGLVWRMAGDKKVYAIAIDDRTFEPVWKSGPFSSTWNSDHTHLFVAGDHVIVTDSDGEIHTLDLATGIELGTTTLPDRAGIEHVCLAGNGADVLLNSACCNNLTVFRLSTQSGAIGPAPKNASCDLIDAPRGESGLRAISDFDASKKSKTPGFWSHSTYAVGQKRVSLGYVRADASTGKSAAPFIMGWDHASGALKWEHPLFMETDVEHSGSQFQAVDNERVYFVYQADRTPTLGAQRVVAWSFDTGALLWSQTLPTSAEGTDISAVSIGGGHVLVVMNHSLCVIDAASGAIQKCMDSF